MKTEIDTTVLVVLAVFFGILATFVVASVRHIPRHKWATFVLLLLLSVFAFVIASALF